jgi:hypothetical protein
MRCRALHQNHPVRNLTLLPHLSQEAPMHRKIRGHGLSLDRKPDRSTKRRTARRLILSC